MVFNSLGGGAHRHTHILTSRAWFKTVEPNGTITQIVSCTYTTIAPSNLNIMLLVGMRAYSSPYKFQRDCICESGDINHIFPYIFYVKGHLIYVRRKCMGKA